MNVLICLLLKNISLSADNSLIMSHRSQPTRQAHHAANTCPK